MTNREKELAAVALKFIEMVNYDKILSAYKCRDELVELLTLAHAALRLKD